MELIFTLKSLYTGSTYVAGPFDIYATTSGGVTTLIGDNISKPTLAAGVTISGVDDATTGGTVQSVDGTCSNSVPWSLTPPTTGCVINQYTFTSTGDGASWSFYTTCDDASLTTITLSGNDSTIMCGRAPILQSGTGSVTDDGPCATCFFYDVVVESLDLAMSDDDTVYFGYTNCNGEYQVNSQNNAGSWTNQFCGTNFSGAYIIQNGISNTGGSTANVTTTPCS
jgi:hypothetical protein